MGYDSDRQDYARYFNLLVSREILPAPHRNTSEATIREMIHHAHRPLRADLPYIIHRHIP